MGNAVGGREGIEDEAVGEISDFEHCFSASIEDASDGVLAQPLEGYVPSTGPPPTVRRASADTMNEPLVGRLVMVHMMEAALVVREAIGVVEQTVASVAYAEIRRLTWDHAQSSLKVGYAPPQLHHGAQDGAVGSSCDPDSIYIAIRVENSLELEDELRQRVATEARRAADAGQPAQASPASLYLGMYAGCTKPKPFQRKRPNLSNTVPEGALPTLKDMRTWSREEHNGISRPQVCSLRSKLAMDAVFQGENRYPLTRVEGIDDSLQHDESPRPRAFRGELVLKFDSIDVQPSVDDGKMVSFSYDAISDWTVTYATGPSPRASLCGLALWLSSGHEDDNDERTDSTGMANRRDGGEHGPHIPQDGQSGGGHRRILLGVPEEDIILVRNSMEFFWNRRRAHRKLPPKPGSAHGRSVASIITLRGEIQAPVAPSGRVDPIDLDGVQIQVGQIIQLSPRRGQVNIMPSPRALLRVEKRRTLRYNSSARSHWERVILHQGWLRKRGGGAIKRWIWRYFALYDTPQGHFLAYYDDASDVPLFREGRRERKLIDLCKVCFLRPENGLPRSSPHDMPANAFTIVTTERQWTLGADSKAGALQWLRMLSVAIDEDVAVVNDGESLFHVKAQRAASGDQYGPEAAASVHVGSMGMELRTDGWESASPWTKFWSFTDFYKWTLVLLHDDSSGLAIQCFTDDDFQLRENILLITPEAKQLAMVIEHGVEKFMAIMHMRVEITNACQNVNVDTTVETAGGELSDAPAEDQDRGAQSPRGVQRIPSMNLATDVDAWDATQLTLAANGRTNPFDSSSDEDDASDVGADPWDGVLGMAAPRPEECLAGLQTSRSNPFDFLDGSGASTGSHVEGRSEGPVATNGACSLGAGEVGADAPPACLSPNTFAALLPLAPRSSPTPCGLDGLQDTWLGATSLSSTPQTACSVVPDMAPRTAAGKMLRTSGTAPPELSSSADEADVFAAFAITNSTAEPCPAVPAGKCLLSGPLLDVDTGDALQETPPITPLMNSRDQQPGFLSAFGEDTPRLPSPSATSTIAATGPLRDPASVAGVASYMDEADFNPFRRPASFTAQARGSSAMAEALSSATSKVLHDDRDALRVAMDSRASADGTVSFVVKYTLALPVATSASISVGVETGPSRSALRVLVDPVITDVTVRGEAKWPIELRQEISISCTGPFSCPPDIVITTRRGRALLETRVPLPVTVSDFLTGLRLSAAEFRRMWTSLPSSEQVTREGANCGGGEGGDRLEGLHERGWGKRTPEAVDVTRFLVNTMGMVEVSPRGRDETRGGVELIAAAAKLVSPPPSEGEMSAGAVCLVGVELQVATGATRIATKSTDPVLTEGVQTEVLRGLQDVRRAV